MQTCAIIAPEVVSSSGALWHSEVATATPVLLDYSSVDIFVVNLSSRARRVVTQCDSDVGCCVVGQ